MKILLSSYVCEPGSGSEEGIGWNTVRELSKYYETWVLTRSIFRTAVEAELAKNPIPNLQFFYFDPFNWTEDWRGRQGWVQLHYFLWQIQAYFIGRSLHQSVGFDLIRHVTYVKYWSPSFVSLLPVPFVWGPVGGGEQAPLTFWRDFTFRGKVYEAARYIAQRIGELDPFTRLTAQRSILAHVTTTDTAQRVQKIGAKNVQIFCESGLSQAEITRLEECGTPTNSPIRFVSIGRLIHWKGFHLAIRAFGHAKLTDAEYWVIGSGAELENLKSIAEELGITSQVKFWGKLPRQETLLRLAESHVLVHPSLHDSGGCTCLEGMAAGRPVICLDLGGPAAQITEETGIKVPGLNPEQAVEGMAEAMIRLAKDPQLRATLGRGGQKRVKDIYEWERKGQFLVNLYTELLNAKPSLVN